MGIGEAALAAGLIRSLKFYKLLVGFASSQLIGGFLDPQRQLVTTSGACYVVNDAIEWASLRGDVLRMFSRLWLKALLLSAFQPFGHRDPYGKTLYLLVFNIFGGPGFVNLLPGIVSWLLKPSSDRISWWPIAEVACWVCVLTVPCIFAAKVLQLLARLHPMLALAKTICVKGSVHKSEPKGSISFFFDIFWSLQRPR